MYDFFLRRLDDGLLSGTIAVHQTFLEQLLKTRLREVGGPSDSDSSDAEDARPAREESICVDIDFAENYEIVH